MPFNTENFAGLRLTPGLLPVALVILMLLAGIARQSNDFTSLEIPIMTK